MIPVTPQPEPAGFDAAVRVPGLKWLADKGIDLNLPLPKKTKIASYWTKFGRDLHQAYGGVCAYLGIHIEITLGAHQVEHYVAKSTLPGRAYDWDNYRLACARMNQRKWNHATVMDPFDVQPGSFQLDLISGKVSPAPTLGAADKAAVEATIKRLKLNDPDCKKMRTDRFDEYHRANLPDWFMAKYSPFIWAEMVRQNLT